VSLDVNHKLNYQYGCYHMCRLIAALLVVFRMSVDEAIQAYTSISRVIHSPELPYDTDKDTILRKDLEKLLERRAIPLNTQLASNDTSTPTAKL
jgi:hypothetical protein